MLHRLSVHKSCVFPRQAILAVPGAGALLDALGAYSQRHAARLDRLRRATFLLDYTLAAMHVVAPGGEGVDADEPALLDPTLTLDLGDEGLLRSGADGLAAAGMEGRADARGGDGAMAPPTILGGEAEEERNNGAAEAAGAGQGILSGDGGLSGVSKKKKKRRAEEAPAVLLADAGGPGDREAGSDMKKKKKRRAAAPEGAADAGGREAAAPDKAGPAPDQARLVRDADPAAAGALESPAPPGRGGGRKGALHGNGAPADGASRAETGGGAASAHATLPKRGAAVRMQKHVQGTMANGTGAVALLAKSANTRTSGEGLAGITSRGSRAAAKHKKRSLLGAR